jgi:Pyridine nucleotide-disulphide oxidoreductase, dimerisation domain
LDKGVSIGKGIFPWAASGRSLTLGRDDGVTKVLFDEETHRIVGCGVVGTNFGELMAEAALAIEMGADAIDIGHTIHPHPTLSETFGMPRKRSKAPSPISTRRKKQTAYKKVHGPSDLPPAVAVKSVQ